MNRRRFIEAGLCAGAAASWAFSARSAAPTLSAKPNPEERKLLIVLFGGGTRSRDTIDDPAHRHIPRLWNEMIPRATLFTNMRVEGKVVHPNSTGSILTGHWEWDDIDWSRPVAHPTVFEIYRKARCAPDTAAWAFVYASILSQAGLSRGDGYGQEFAANVVEPPTIPRSTAEEMDRLMRAASARGSTEAGLEAARQCAALARSTSRIAEGGLRSDEARRFVRRYFEAWRQGAAADTDRNTRGETDQDTNADADEAMGADSASAEGAGSIRTTSHDAFLAECALACMKRFAPGVLCVAFGEIDCAHYGSWSRYVEAIRRTDELTWRLWRAAETLDAYRGRTLMLILPDHGRELEESGGQGFIHHSDFYTGQGADEGCRRVWMLELAPGLQTAAAGPAADKNGRSPTGRRIDRPIPITSVAATGLQFLGLSPSPGAAPAAGA